MISIAGSDPLKHFSRERPLVKLVALLISRAHINLWSIGAAAAAIGKALGAL
ncbi:hypothetical protein LXT13_09025 [Pelomonas sp. P8]|uniref:Uncharacterized protein n=1 Tax=Pelomonas cellulosilytica TaxID=2906762 RepID=A0ABS8XYY0_9BURK|nr:hypothetical protein [Pelomonas sp. P8]